VGDLVALGGLLVAVQVPAVGLLLRVESRLARLETITRACPGHPEAAPPPRWRRSA
jgi:hypothetical protein